jgi:hypothetical protein
MTPARPRLARAPIRAPLALASTRPRPGRLSVPVRPRSPADLPPLPRLHRPSADIPARGPRPPGPCAARRATPQPIPTLDCTIGTDPGPPHFLSPNIPGGGRAPGAAGGQRPPFSGLPRGAAR